MIDFGIANILTAQPSMQQKRADRQMELVILKQRQAEVEQAMQQQAEGNAALAEYFKTLSSFQLLQPDKERLKEVTAPIKKQMIADVINKYGGNTYKYMQMEGQLAKEKYYSAVVESEQLAKGMRNKLSYYQFVADRSSAQRRIVRPTAWETSEGKRAGTFEENVADYFSGETNMLNYRGAFELPPIKATEFARIPNPENPYQPSKVKLNYFKDALIAGGLSPEDAEYAAPYFEDPEDKNFTPFWWGSKEKPKEQDGLDEEYKRLRNEALKKKLAKGETNPVADMYMDIATSNIKDPSLFVQAGDKFVLNEQSAQVVTDFRIGNSPAALIIQTQPNEAVKDYLSVNGLGLKPVKTKSGRVVNVPDGVGTVSLTVPGSLRKVTIPSKAIRNVRYDSVTQHVRLPNGKFKTFIPLTVEMTDDVAGEMGAIRSLLDVSTDEFSIALPITNKQDTRPLRETEGNWFADDIEHLTLWKEIEPQAVQSAVFAQQLGATATRRYNPDWFEEE